MGVQRFAYLDVLKAIAVIAVVLYHVGFLKYGYLGVDIFLVIAGFLTTKSLADGKKGYAVAAGFACGRGGCDAVRMVYNAAR